MDSIEIIKNIGTIIALLAGGGGLILGILNYFRDKPNVQILLQWDMQSFDLLNYDSNKLWGIVSITNIGRRPIFVSHLVLETSNNKECLLISESIGGIKILEGDAPHPYVITQEGLEKYASSWREMRASLTDSTGKKYYSNTPTKCPSWAVSINEK